MKKQALKLSAIALLVSATAITGCKKDDVTAPTVTLTGNSSVYIPLQGTYIEVGASAEDDKDGEVEATASGTVNTDLVGAYTITYTATDAAGNSGTATRTVYIYNEADEYAGTYDCSDPAFGAGSDWVQTITASSTVNKRVVFSKFAGRTGNSTIEADLIGGTQFKIVDATVAGLGVNGCTFDYTNNGVGGTITKTGGKYTFTIKYFEARQAGGTSCTAVAATAFEDTFTQQ